MTKIYINNLYKQIYQHIESAKEKEIKIILTTNLQGAILVDVNKLNLCFSNLDEKQSYISQKQASINFLITEILLESGNRGKIKLRNFFYKSLNKIWGKMPVS